MSVTVTSHARHFPNDHGIWVTPSGRLPSVLTKPCGSLMAGTPALMRDRQMISLRHWCLLILPADFLQTKPCKPLWSTWAPQGQRWGSQSFAPSLKPTADLISSLSRRRPQAEIGRAWSQSLLWVADTASSLALSIGLSCRFNSWWNCAWQTLLSNWCCLSNDASGGCSAWHREDQ